MVQDDLAAQPQSRPRRRPAQRPAEILDAAAQVFAKWGYDRATTKEIAAAAGVSEGTLYRYFENKKGILLALLKDFMDKALADVAHLPAGSFEEWVAHTVAGQIRMAHERPFTIMILQQAITDPDVGRTFVEMNTHLRQEVTLQMAKLEATGALRDIDPFVAGEAMGSMIMGLTVGVELGVYGWHEEPLSPETLSKGIADVLMNGLHTRSKVRKSHLKES
jgi:AcrR family transcriptional regulator